MPSFRSLALLAFLALLMTTGCEPAAPEEPAEAVRLRVATYNIEDVQTADVLDADQPRLKAAAAAIQQLRPDVLLVQEMTYDQPGAPGVAEGDAPGQNARRFAETFLAVSQGEGLEPLRYRAWMPPVNTGQASGLDLDRSGEVVTEYPDPGPAGPEGAARRQPPEARAYGNDAYGYGVFPGQYGMAVLVREDLEILADSVRSFQRFAWADLPGAASPVDPATGEAWYDAATWPRLRLSSKTHADVPVRLPNGAVLHLLVSHPTPPAFDGPEGRNKVRNRDEIRLWNAYLDDAPFLVDDAGRTGGLAPDAPFVIMGDLNADPDEGSSLDDPVGGLMAHPRVQPVRPEADSSGRAAFPDLDPDDTAHWGLGVDYVLPSEGLEVVASGVARSFPITTPEVSDHFPVWVDLVVPAPAER